MKNLLEESFSLDQHGRLPAALRGAAHLSSNHSSTKKSTRCNVDQSVATISIEWGCSLSFHPNTMSTSEIRWFGMKLTPAQKQKIKRLAARAGTSAKEAIMHLVDEALDDEEPLKAPEGSFLDGIEHLIGSLEGPGDLSTNPKYMEGFGE